MYTLQWKIHYIFLAYNSDENLEEIFENNKWLDQYSSNTYHWLILDGLISIISMNPYKHLLSKELRIKKKSQYLIDNKRNLCEHGLLHPMTARKGKYIPHNVHTSMEDTFKNKLAYNSELGLDSSFELTHFNNHDISDKNMTCADCIKNLWDDMSRKKTEILKELHALVKALSTKKKVLVQKHLESVKHS